MFAFLYDVYELSVSFILMIIIILLLCLACTTTKQQKLQPRSQIEATRPVQHTLGVPSYKLQRNVGRERLSHALSGKEARSIKNVSGTIRFESRPNLCPCARYRPQYNRSWRYRRPCEHGTNGLPGREDCVPFAFLALVQ